MQFTSENYPSSPLSIKAYIPYNKYTTYKMISKLKLLQLIFFSATELRKKKKIIYFTLAYPSDSIICLKNRRQYPGVEDAHNLGLK